jgi:hypothetical protein
MKSKSDACGMLFNRLDKITTASKRATTFKEVTERSAVEWDLCEATMEKLGYTTGDFVHITSGVLYDRVPLKERMEEEWGAIGEYSNFITPCSFFDPNAINELVNQNGGDLPQYFLLSVNDWYYGGMMGLFIVDTEDHPYCRYLIHVGR